VTDVKLRELERRWKESGAPEDELAWLTGRVRSGERLDWESYSRLTELDVPTAADYLRKRVDEGDLTQERLELAAFSGHRPAGRVLGTQAGALSPEGLQEDPPDSEGIRRGLFNRLQQFAQRSSEAGVAACVGCHEAAQRAWQGTPEALRSARGAEAAQAWLVRPSEESLNHCREVYLDLQRSIVPNMTEATAGPTYQRESLLWCGAYAALAALPEEELVRLRYRDRAEVVGVCGSCAGDALDASAPVFLTAATEVVRYSLGH